MRTSQRPSHNAACSCSPSRLLPARGPVTCSEELKRRIDKLMLQGIKRLGRQEGVEPDLFGIFCVHVADAGGDDLLAGAVELVRAGLAAFMREHTDERRSLGVESICSILASG